MSWSAEQYVAFEDERTRPARDLLAGVPLSDARVAVDLGCGPGNSTGLLAARFPQAQLTGLDTSEDMIAAARSRLPSLRFEVADIQTWVDDRSSGPLDLIFANAVLHWVPGHSQLFPALVAKLAPGGCLAVQMPDNLGEPAAMLMRKIAEEAPWREKLAKAHGARIRIEPADWYYRLLRESSSRVEVWRTTYHHPLAGTGAIVEWFKGTGLLPFLGPLDGAERAEYLARYTRALGSAYPAAADGTVLLPFPRLFIVARR